jgi:hypothetical protein
MFCFQVDRGKSAEIGLPGRGKAKGGYVVAPGSFPSAAARRAL